MEQLLKETKEFFQKAWEKSGFNQLTDVQKSAIPPISAGKDAIVEAPTGTGKTLAYLWPVLNKVDSETKELQAVILASSQELVMQILKEVQKWGEGSGIRSASMIGGANVKRQIEKLKKHPHIIVGTPGRVFELVKQKKIKMHHVKTIVIDEGDQLLTFEHLPAVQSIIRSALAERQVLFFSATMSDYMIGEAKELTNEAVVIQIKKDETIQSGKVQHFYFLSEKRDKIKILEKIGRLNGEKTLVFFRDIGNLTVTAEKLAYKGIDAAVIHSELHKDKRKKALKQFRANEVPLLLATDVAARGLDIQGITVVVHFDFPKDMEQYIHRSGRTGRFGAEGTVISIVTPREERELKKFFRKLQLPLVKKQFYEGKIVDA